MITGLNHVTLSVLDLDRSFEFYTQILSFQPLAKWKKGAYLLAGDLWFTLYQGLQFERTV
ncbi:MAG: VOC family protein, partial [Cyanobacteria bacterium J06576_12]